MAYSVVRFSLAGALVVAITACSAGGAGLAPAAHRAAEGAKTTQAIFTIHWTNPSAPAAVRRKDTISPSAQSVSVIINGSTSAIANRTTQPTQSIALQAPVGTDEFTFNIYDLPNAQGTLLGSASVTQLIVDGAANTVSAVIQAVCAQTNIQYLQPSTVAPVSLAYSGTAGSIARSLTSIELLGPTPETLQVGPEDPDGNVIISGTGGTIQYTISGSAASITPLNGANLQLTPLSTTPTTAPSTLVASAPSCPSTSVSISSSPAIYAQEAGNSVLLLDWHGTIVYTLAINSGDVLVGYVADDNWMLAYNKTSGNFTHYDPLLLNPQNFPSAGSEANSLVAFSNDVNDTICAAPSSGLTEISLNCDGSIFAATLGTPVAIASSTWSTSMSSTSNNFFVASSSTVFAFTVYNGTMSASASPGGVIVGLATDDRISRVYVFRSTTPYAVQYTEGLSAVNNESWITVVPAFGATDTDNDDIYVYGTNGVLQAATTSGGGLSGFNNGYGPPVGLVVVSVNEH